MLWSKVHYSEQPVTDPRLNAYLSELTPLYVNGRVLFRCFQPTDSAAFQAASRHDLRGLDHLLTSFLSAPTVRLALTELQLPSKFKGSPPFHYYSAFEMEGALTVALLRGGAYKRFAGSEDEARRLARGFVSAIGHDYAEVFKITAAWTDWFYDVAWDSSFVVLSQQQLKWWVLCMTDTD